MLRSIGSALRGKATPPQILMATVLGGMLGFVPGFFLAGDLGGGFMQAPGTILLLLGLALVLNTNLAVFGITLAVAQLLSRVLLPVSFEVGRWLLDGPMQGMFRGLVNAPVFAWFGLERYATTGGLVVGLSFGIAAGWLVLRIVHGFRVRMSEVEQNSERYRQWSSKKSVRVLAWVLLGSGKGKRSYAELAESEKKGLPVRILGVVAVLVVCVGIWLGQSFLTGPAFRNSVRTSLEYWNGATVDLNTASIDLAGGKATLAGLGMADLRELTRDLFAARSLELEVATGDLLSKRFVVDRIESREAVTGALRDEPGEPVRAPSEPPPPPPADDAPGKTLEEYLAEAEVWKARLQQVAEWLQKLAGSDDTVAGETDEQRDQRIAALREQYALADIIASHLIDETPLVRIRELLFEGVTAVEFGGRQLDIRAKNLSSNPRLVAEPMEIAIVSRDGALRIGFVLDAGSGAPSLRADFALSGLVIDDFMARLQHKPLRGGTMDVSIGGTLDLQSGRDVRIDLPLRVELRGTTLTLPGVAETQLDSLTLPIGVRGPLAAPRISLDDAALADALLAAGKRELATQVRARATELLGDKVPGLDLDGTPEEILERAKREAAEAARKRVEEEAGKLLPGLFGGKRDK